MDELILQGRALIEKYRLDHGDIYTKGLSNAQKMTSHNALASDLTVAIKLLGFKDLDDFFMASYIADEKEVPDDKDWWR